MERHVKERLIGAAVLMAAAIILIPEMLSGPERTEAPAPARSATDETIKTYTIDLNGSSGTAPPTVMEEPAPPQERIEPTPAAPEAERVAKPAASDEAEPESVAAATSATSRSAPARTETPPRSPPAQSQRPASVQPESARHEPSQQSEPPATRGWAVQLGSYSNRSTAEQLSAQYRGQGYPAFVMPVTTGAATLYRVRIGPMRERAGAEETLRKISASAEGAAVVVHP